MHCIKDAADNVWLRGRAEVGCMQVRVDPTPFPQQFVERVRRRENIAREDTRRCWQERRHARIPSDDAPQRELLW